jgi:hypothetical protein
VGDSSLEYDISDSSDTACCDNPNDCVYNGVCYSPGTAPGIDVDMDGDNDYCGDLGTWWDCGGSGTSMCHAENYETCISHNCLVNCSARPCLANQSTCTDYKDGEMECVNTTRESWISSFVEYPAGSQDDEIYCKEGYYCDPDGECTPKQTEDICATVFDTDACGTLNVPSMLECGYASLRYCEGIHVSMASIIEATDEPLKKVGNGPQASSNFYTERPCIDTDGGRNTNVWGCAYNITSLNHETTEDLDGYIWCDYAEDDSHLIEYYCYEGNIRAARYECDVLGDNLASPQAQCKASATLKENSLSYIELKRTPHTDYMQ